MSLSEVARRAGVSIATASRVLNGSPLATAGMTEKVMAVANSLGYAPDPRFRLMGQNRSGGKRRTGPVGLLLPEHRESAFVADPYYGRLFWSIEREARRHDRQIFISTINDDLNGQLPDFIKDMRVDGVLIAHQFAPRMIERLEELLPVVQVNTAAQSVRVPAVMPDEDSGIRQALSYLVELGHRDICYFDIHDLDLHVPNLHHVLRASAFDRWARELGIKEARSKVLSSRTGTVRDTARDAMLEWRNAGKMPTALLCGADIYAISFLEAAEELGISIPDEISVIGIDDTILCEHVRPKLTSVRQPLEMMGARAMEWLVQRIERGDSREIEATVQKIDVRLVHRNSCAPPRKAG